MEEVINYLNSVRRDYAGEELSKRAVAKSPFDQLAKWLEEAVNAQVLDPAAMIISTVDREGKPSARTVLLRGHSENGIIFYTNYESKKGQDLLLNPFVAITFLWVELDRQIRITGKAEKTTYEQSDQYFSQRPRESQISAIASPQSRSLKNREELEELFKRAKSENEKLEEIPCPDNWGGFLIVPDSFEFWQGRPNRLHDRIRYNKTQSDWELERLAP